MPIFSLSLHCQQIFNSVGMGTFHQLFGSAATLGSLLRAQMLLLQPAFDFFPAANGTSMTRKSCPLESPASSTRNLIAENTLMTRKMKITHVRVILFSSPSLFIACIVPNYG